MKTISVEESVHDVVHHPDPELSGAAGQKFGVEILPKQVNQEIETVRGPRQDDACIPETAWISQVHNPAMTGLHGCSLGTLKSERRKKSSMRATTSAATPSCNRQLVKHVKGKKLPALLVLQALTHRSGFFFQGAGRSPTECNRNLIRFLVENGICSESWARRTVRELHQEGWLKYSTFKNRPAIRVRNHAQWGRELKRTDCFFGTKSRGHDEGDPSIDFIVTKKGTASTAVLSAADPIETIVRKPVSEEFKEVTVTSFKERIEEIDKEVDEEKKPTCPAPDSRETSGFALRSSVGIDDETANSETIKFLDLVSDERIRWYGRGLELRSAKELQNLRFLIREHGVTTVVNAYEKYLNNKSKFLCVRNHPFALFVSQIEDHLSTEQFRRKRHVGPIMDLD
jgi:hypothetical protein